MGSPSHSGDSGRSHDGVGTLFFATAMMRQYRHHDYYFLDSFFLPTLLLLALALRSLPTIEELVSPTPQQRVAHTVASVVFVVAAVLMYDYSHHHLKMRRMENERAMQCLENFEKGDQLLDNMGYGTDARPLVLLAYPQNMPLIQLNREGYVVMEYDTTIVENALQFPYDCIVIEDSIYKQNFAEHSEVLSRLVREGGNGRLSICHLTDSVTNLTAESFFGM